MINNALNLSPPVRLSPLFIRVDFNSTSCVVLKPFLLHLASHQYGEDWIQ